MSLHVSLLVWYADNEKQCYDLPNSLSHVQGPSIFGHLRNDAYTPSRGHNYTLFCSFFFVKPIECQLCSRFIHALHSKIGSKCFASQLKPTQSICPLQPPYLLILSNVLRFLFRCSCSDCHEVIFYRGKWNIVPTLYELMLGWSHEYDNCPVVVQFARPFDSESFH